MTHTRPEPDQALKQSLLLETDIHAYPTNPYQYLKMQRPMKANTSKKPQVPVEMEGSRFIAEGW